MLPTQIADMILDVEHNGHAVIPVMEMTRTTEEALGQLNTIYGIWLPGCSINYIIAKKGNNFGEPSETCTIQGLSKHNAYQLGRHPAPT
jgi:hypothetical protein